MIFFDFSGGSLLIFNIFHKNNLLSPTPGLAPAGNLFLKVNSRRQTFGNGFFNNFAVEFVENNLFYISVFVIK